MTRILATSLALLAVAAGGCTAAVPRVDDVEITGAVRLVTPEGAIVSAGGVGLPVLVVKAGAVCTGDLDGRVAGEKGIESVDAVPSGELALDCVGFAPHVVFASWSPDSRRVAFMGASEGAESDIWVYDTGGGAVTNLSGDAGEDTLPLWVDERSVVFVRTIEGPAGPETSWQLASIDSGVPVELATVPGSVELGQGAKVVAGEPGAVLFNLTRPDGTPAGIHRLDLGSGAIVAVWSPSEGDRAMEGFRLLDVHPDARQALIVVGGGGIDAAGPDVRLVDLTTGTQRSIVPLFGSGMGDVRFSGDGTRLLVWERGTDGGDALVVRSTGSDEDAEVLLSGELGGLDAVERGVVVDSGRDLVLVRIEP